MIRVAALLLPLLALTPGCVLTSVVFVASASSSPPQVARLEPVPGGAQVVIEEVDGPRRLVHRLPGVDPSSHQVRGGPEEHPCACRYVAYGLVDFREPTPFVLVDLRGEVIDPTRALGPILDPAVTWTGVLVPLTFVLDLALLPLEAVFVGLVTLAAD